VIVQCPGTVILGSGWTVGKLILPGRNDEVVSTIRAIFDTYEVCLI
jgi:hypothetical protein